jgi:hypothetical protein
MDEIKNDVETYYKQIADTIQDNAEQYIGYNSYTWQNMYDAYNDAYSRTPRESRNDLVDRERRLRARRAASEAQADAAQALARQREAERENLVQQTQAIRDLFNAPIIETGTYGSTTFTIPREVVDRISPNKELTDRIAALEKKLASLENRAELVKEQNEPEHRKIST